MNGASSDSVVRFSLHATRPLIVVAVTGIMLAWTWRSCPHPLIDFGREIYVPWRITEGDVLYRDLNWFNGPLSPYFNATIFSVFGVSLLALKLTNALITILVALLVYRLIREISDCLTGVVAGIAFATIFACGHIIPPANFNFLTPYSHELTHGVALALVMLGCLWKASQSERTQKRTHWFALAGLSLGMVLLTKMEIALAAVAGAGTGLGMMLIPQTKREPATKHLTFFVIGVLLPPLIAVILLSFKMPLSRAIIDTTGAWVWITDSRISDLPFFKWVLGTDRFERNVGRMMLWLLRYAVLLVPAVALGLMLRKKLSTQQRIVLPLVVALLVAAPLVWWWDEIPWEGAIRPLPLVLVVMLAILGIRCLGTGTAPPPQTVLAVSVAAFSLALLAKMLFNVHSFHYGFVLSMPGTMLLIAAIVAWIPRWVDRAGGFGWIPRSAALAALVVLMGGHVYTTGRNLAMRHTPVGSGADFFLADERGDLINRALQRLKSEMHPGDTLMVMPEGVMLNYLLRVPSPVRWQNFLPSEMMMYGETTMLEALKRRPPASITVVHRDAREYDARRFGYDYARRIERWIADSYTLVDIQGAMPFESDEFGILLLRHKSTATSAPSTR